MNMLKGLSFPIWVIPCAHAAAVTALLACLALWPMPAAGAEDAAGRKPVLSGMPAPAQASRSSRETSGKRGPAKTPKRTWSLADAARPYRGMTVTASFLPRPGYEAAIKLIPEFEKLTGIKVKWESIYYEKMREALVLNFTSGKPRFDVVLIDLVWIGEFASAGWVAPLAPFYNNPALADPHLDLKDFFPLLLESFGT